TFVRKAGTEGYAPPEQYTTAGQAGPWSDVYGIGATLYHLLTGCIPPTAVDRVALDARLIHPRDIAPSISLAVDAAVCKALALRPIERFQSVLDFSRALLGVSAGTSLSGASRATPQAPAPHMTPPPPIVTSSAATPSAQPPFRYETPLAAASWTPSPQPPVRTPFQPSPPRAASLTPSSAEISPRRLNASAAPSPAVPMSTPALSSRQRANTRGDLNDPVLEPADASAESRRRVVTGPRLLLASVTLLILAAVAGGAGFLLASAPPDRSSPTATVTGYFNALHAQDYARAWQFMSASRGGAGSQDQFTQNQQADDARYGKVMSATITHIDGANTPQATVQVDTTRGQNETA